MQLIKMPKIQNTNDILNSLSYERQFIGLDENKEPVFDKLQLPLFEITGTVKLHGTNSAVVFTINHSDDIETATFHTQSKNTAFRSGTLTGHFDFNLFANQNINSFKNIAKQIIVQNDIRINANDTIAIFGEWVGPGIQKGVAISSIPNRKFFLFSVKLNEKYVDISKCHFVYQDIHNIYNYEIFKLMVDNTKLQELKNEIETLVLYVEESCPVAKAFGVNGIGEGIVWTGSYVHPFTNKPTFVQFKSKGEKHSNVQKDKRVKLNDITIPENVLFVVNEIDVENRVHQMITEHFNGINPGKSQTGKIIELVLNDIALEETLLMNSNQVEFHEIKPLLTKRIVNYYFTI